MIPFYINFHSFIHFLSCLLIILYSINHIAIGVVKKVFDKYVGLIRMLDSGDVLKIDQAHLETVIPNIGQRVSMVNGAYRGEEATLLSIDMDQFKAKVRLETGPHLGTTINADYEYICKIHKQ